jgi:hypothetical protein
MIRPKDLPSALSDLVGALDALDTEQCRSIVADAAALEQVRRACRLLHALHQFADGDASAWTGVPTVIERSRSGRARTTVLAESAEASLQWDPRAWSA